MRILSTATAIIHTSRGRVRPLLSIMLVGLATFMRFPLGYFVTASQINASSADSIEADSFPEDSVEIDLHEIKSGYNFDVKLIEDGVYLSPTFTENLHTKENDIDVTVFADDSVIAETGYKMVDGRAKQTILLSNNAEYERVLDVMLSSSVSVAEPVITWNGDMYEVNNDPLVIHHREGEQGEIQGTSLLFIDEHRLIGEYDWSDIVHSGFEYEIAVYLAGNEVVIDTVVKDIIVEANSETIVDPNYALSDPSNYDARYDGIADSDYLSYLGLVFIEDVNCDGDSDLIMGAPWADSTNIDGGSIFVIFGGDATGNRLLSSGSNYNIRIDGAAAGDYLGDDSAVRFGDVNGDSCTDMILGAQFADNNGYFSGSVWILFSTLIDDVTTTGNIWPLSDEDYYNIRYDGDLAYGYLTELNAMAVGDVNGDGLGDLVVGEGHAENGGSLSGSVFVFFSTLIDDVGSSTGNIKPLVQGSSYNIRYDASSGDYLAYGQVVAIGDVNGDGNGDLIMGAQEANDLLGGSVWVIFSTLIDDVTTTGNNHSLYTDTYYNIRYDGGAGQDNVPENIRVGDVNGDGYSDLVFSGIYADNGAISSGSVWVIFSTLIDDVGEDTGQIKSLYDAGEYNIRYDGMAYQDYLARNGAVAIGDVNGDGDGDLILGTPYSDLGGTNSGAAWIMFSTLIDNVGETTGNNKSLSTGTNYNVRYNAPALADWITSGGEYTAIHIGDLNADGVDDLIMAGYGADNNGSSSGSAWIFYSTRLDDFNDTTGNDIALTSDTYYDVRYDGAADSDYLVQSGAIAIGDLDGDSVDDLVLGARGADNNGVSGSGSVYVIFAEPAAPTIALTPLSPDPTTDTTPSFTGTATDADQIVVSVEFQIDGTGGSWTSCTADDGAFDELSEAFTCDIPSALSLGPHVIYVRGEDFLGNITPIGLYGTDSFTVVTASPPMATPLTVSTVGGDTYTGTSVTTSDPTPTFTGTAAPNAGVTITIEGSSGTIIGTTTADGSGNWSWTPGTDLADDTYSVTIVAEDGVGGTDSESFTLVIDRSFGGGTPFYPGGTTPDSEDLVGDGEEESAIDGESPDWDTTDGPLSLTDIERFLDELLSCPEQITWWPYASTVLIGLLAILQVVGFSLGDLPYYYHRSRLGILYALGIRTKGKPWGVVYDSVSKKLLSRSIVRLYNNIGELVDTEVTDVNGVFSFEPMGGTYRMNVQCSGYEFPSKVIKGNTDGPRKNVYNGGDYEVKGDRDPVRVYIPMDRQDLSPLVKWVVLALTKGLEFLTLVSPFLLMIGLWLSVYYYRRDGGLLHVLMFAVYMMLLLMYVVGWLKERGSWGYTVNNEGYAMPGVELGLYDDTYQRLIDTRISDEKGRFRFVVVGGEYVIRPVGTAHIIDEAGYEGGYVVGRDVKEEQLIKERVVVRKAGQKDA